MTTETEKQAELKPDAGGAGGKGEEQPQTDKRTDTRYRILWGKMPDPEADRAEADDVARPTYREILNPHEPDGAYVATSAETARRRAFLDEETDQYPFIQKALKSHGVVMKHVALSSWGDDQEALAAPLKIETREDLTGRV